MSQEKKLDEVYYELTTSLHELNDEVTLLRGELCDLWDQRASHAHVEAREYARAELMSMSIADRCGKSTDVLLWESYYRYMGRKDGEAGGCEC